MKKFLIKRDTLLATIFVFIIIYLLEIIAINWKILNPFVHSFRDFEITDIYYSKLRTKITIDTNIILVNAENLTRAEIAGQLNILNRYNPKVIGVDLLFREKKDDHGDSLLKLALHQNRNTVLPYSINSAGNENKTSVIRIHPFFGDLYTGYIDLCGDSASTVREFNPFLKFGKDDSLSFDTKIVQLYDPDAYRKLVKRENLKERINYIGNIGNFIHLNVMDVLKNPDKLSIVKDKIVLVGYFGSMENGNYCNFEDLHFTPVNPKISGRARPDMNGVTIHANIISMILADKYINVMPDWLTFLMAFLLCYINIAFLIHTFIYNPKWLHFFGKVIQLIASVILLLLVFYVYRLFSYRIESTLIIAAIVLSVEILYFYNGLVVWLNARFNFKTIMLHNHK